MKKNLINRLLNRHGNTSFSYENRSGKRQTYKQKQNMTSSSKSLNSKKKFPNLYKHAAGIISIITLLGIIYNGIVWCMNSTKQQKSEEIAKIKTNINRKDSLIRLELTRIKDIDSQHNDSLNYFGSLENNIMNYLDYKASFYESNDLANYTNSQEEVASVIENFRSRLEKLNTLERGVVQTIAIGCILIQLDHELSDSITNTYFLTDETKDKEYLYSIKRRDSIWCKKLDEALVYYKRKDFKGGGAVIDEIKNNKIILESDIACLNFIHDFLRTYKIYLRRK